MEYQGMHLSTRRYLAVGLYTAGAALCAAVGAFLGHAAFRGRRPPPNVDVLTPSGAGLEYGEWLWSLIIITALSMISLLLAILLAWLARRRWRAKPAPSPFPVAPL